ncbi:hypothetical protein TW65_05398 [Stemphylium lycopersici]|uniref:Uncharacterized protein n=1 Tax=Stemphylium lycopersici TaxID=183478 RepID=A0A364N6K9_STELY|nr:hypothetical protein TW65_05398 [Stemphylium lycopersici]RAR12949.1 hypothetical protein DDE83_003749 [Stemphylium lycopersici]
MAEQSLEQRIYDLLLPFRDECWTTSSPSTPPEAERAALVLCENMAFLIRHNQSSYGKMVVPSDITIGSYKWASSLGSDEDGRVGIAIFVNGNGYTHTVVRKNVERKGEAKGVVETLNGVVEADMKAFFHVG